MKTAYTLPGNTPPLDPSRYRDFAEQLLAWHKQHGRHDLPWQQPRTPYRVWLSEIMLQQTQVTTVIPYFQRFIAQFPDVASLAAADIDSVLSLWSGLGYYARARNLHKTAQLIMHDHAGKFPETAAELNALPGIGLSTANAILAQAYNQPAPILDGNVKRILARQIALDQPPLKAIKPLWEIAELITPSHDAANFTQAIMDLGALLCKRTRADCPSCPVQDSCQAYQQDRVADFPVKAAKKMKPEREQDFFLYMKEDSQQDADSEHHSTALIYLVQRESTGIWGGLWCLPEQPEPAFAQLSNPQPLTPLRHTFTHFHLTLHPQLCRLPANSALDNRVPGSWFSPQAALKKGLPAPIRLLIERIIEPDLLNEIKY